MRKALFWLVISLIVIRIFYKIFYISPAVDDFIEAIAIRYESQSQPSYIRIEDITNFQWTDVCYVSPEFTTKFYNPYNSQYAEKLARHLPTFHKASHWGAYYFLDDGEVTKKIVFNAMGFRVTNSGFYPMGLNTFLSGHRYVVMAENNSSNDLCVVRSAAALKISFDEQWSEGSIVLTNVIKEKNK